MSKLTARITAIWRKIPSAIRSGWVTAWVAFTGTLLTIVTGLLPVLANSISSKNFQPFYDALSTSASLSVSAATGFIAGVVNGIYRFVKPIEQAYNQTPPKEG